MSALSIRNMNFTLQRREQIQWKKEAEEYSQGDIFEQLESSMKASNTLKRSEMTWARKMEKNACVFCKLAFKHHGNERSTFDQMKTLASIQLSTQYQGIDQWQRETEVTRKSDYPL